MAEEIGALRAVLALESAAFDKGVASARRQLGAMDGSLQKTGGQVVQFGQRVSRDGARAFNDLNRSAGASRAGLQNVGFQVQDLAVQIAGGTSATRALAQQLPQLLSGFGLFGVLAGTASAILIPLAGILFSTGEKAKTSGEAVTELASAVNAYIAAADAARAPTDQLVEKYGGLATAARDALVAQQAVTLVNAMTATNAVIAAVVTSMTNLQDKVVMSDDGFSRTVETIRVLNDNFGMTEGQVDALRNALSALNDAEGLTEQAEAAQSVSDALLDTYRSVDAMPAPLQAVYGQMAEIVLQAGEVQTKMEGMANPLSLAVDLAGQLSSIASGLAGAFSSADGAAAGLANTLLAAAKAAWALAQGRLAADGQLAQMAVEFSPGGQAAIAYGGRTPGGTDAQNALDKRMNPPDPKTGGGAAQKEANELQREAARVFAQTRTEAEKYGIELGKLNTLLAAGEISQDTFNRAVDDLKDKAGEASSAAQSMESAFSSAFGSFVTGAESARDAVSNLLASLADTLANEAFSAFSKGLFGDGGVGGAFAGAFNLNANGNAFSNGRVTAFASGGVVNSPTVFPMANGAGLMGEAGPEAIMPLTRIGGKLGVRSSGGGGTVVNIDARGAVEGTAAQIDARLRQAMPDILRQSVSANRAAGARGY
jgi:hypothetical protein